MADEVCVTIDGRSILEGASIECVNGKVTALIGPSGCGKTVLLHCMGLLQKPTSGRIVIAGVGTGQWSTSQRRRFWRDHAAFVLQDYGIMHEESAAFNVTLERTLRRGAVRRNRLLIESLERAGLDGREREPAARLSGGEKQRLALARAEYKSADVVLIDEPTASLDPESRDRVVKHIRSLAADGRTVVVATHDSAMIACSDLKYQLPSESKESRRTRRAERAFSEADEPVMLSTRNRRLS